MSSDDTSSLATDSDDDWAQKKRGRPKVEAKEGEADEDVEEEGEQQTKRPRWINRERVLMICSRGTAARHRHLLNDLKSMMPHAKTESKVDKKRDMRELNEICELANCQKCIYFESRKNKDLYLWLSNVPSGPCYKFLVTNVHTMAELKLTGNCLKGSRPILSFDADFDEKPHFALLKELLTQIFGTPNNHPRSQPFVDRCLAFSIDDNRVWLRNYQIVEEPPSIKLEEVGPRCTLQLIRVFDGSFGGPVLYENAGYVSPNALRAAARKRTATLYTSRVESRKAADDRRKAEPVAFRRDDTDAVFDTKRSRVEPMEDWMMETQEELQAQEAELPTREKLKKRLRKLEKTV